jgi:pimeloyl-ACP methyl ester carboxylesterase
VAQSPAPRVPPGGDLALACGQSPDGRTYWTEYGFCDIAPKGPAAAKGIVFWSHGVSGDREQFRGSPAPVVRQLATAGWDVIKINRNNLYEKGWVTSGVRHRDDAIERARAARAQGYRAVILAGQSYGGAISLEANARSDGIDGVLALSPGHGSDVGQAGGGGGGLYFSLDRYLLEALAGQRGGRVVISLPPNDLLHPNRHSASGYMGARMREALAKTGRPFVVFDETLPINGHGAGTTNQFATWFGPCITRFLTGERTPAAGETTCPPPNPVPTFLVPPDYKMPMPGSTGISRFQGAWQGMYDADKREVFISIDQVKESGATMIYSVGPGPQRSLSMGFDRYGNAKFSGDTMTVERGNNRQIVLTLGADGETIALKHMATSGTVTGTMKRVR